MMLKMVLATALLTGCLMPPGGFAPASSGTTHDPAPMSSSSSPSPGTAPAPESAAAPSTVSVTIRSACRKTAKVFYGEKPGFSSGTQSSVSSNSVSSKTFRVGDQMWVLDDSGKPLGNVEVSANTRQIEISESCASLSTR